MQERESLGRTVVVLHWLQASGQLFFFFFPSDEICKL